MKKILSTIAATALIATSSFALDTSKVYAGASVALESATGMDSGFALILNGGLPIMAAGEVGPGTLAVEGEFTYSIVAPSYTYTVPSYSYYGYTSAGSSETYDFSIMTLGAYGAYIFDINEQFFVKPRVGLIYKSIDAGYGATASEIGLAFGVQGGYKLNEKMDIIAGYNLVDGTDITHLSIGINYHFN